MRLQLEVMAAVAVAASACSGTDASSDDAGGTTLVTDESGATDGSGDGPDDTAGTSTGSGGDGSTSGAPPSSGTLRVLSYNVAGLPAILSGSNPAENMQHISPLLNDFELVLVQEDWLTPELGPDDPFSDLEVYHDLLVADATHRFQSVPDPVPLGMDRRRPTALVSDGLNRLSRSEFGELTRTMWKDCFGGINTSDGGAGDCLSLKGFSVATHVLAPGVEVDVYNLHGEAGGTETDQQLQREGYADLAEYIEANSVGRAVLLAGDTNLHTHDGHPDGDGDADARIWADFQASTGLVDVCEIVSPCETGIDKFAVRSDGATTITPLSQAYPTAMFQHPDGGDLSDHPPAVVELAWDFAP
jgi:hypothetical protein